MSVNHHMHPRNIYKKPPNFVKLALEYPEFQKFVKQDLSGKVSVNFKEREAVLALTKALLDSDFGLSLTLPENRLVPTLPLRLNYILWLEDLLQLKQLARKEQVHGIDIGTGAACIYPLLAAKKNNWKMLATEVDGVSIQYANSNVTSNELTDLIKVEAVTSDSVLMDVIKDKTGDFDFCMCNPPFFASEAELQCRPERNPPRNAPTGCKSELVATGGEVAFVKRIIHESEQLGTKVRVYTTMLGKKTSLKELQTYLGEKGKQIVTLSVGTSEFCQGHTTRWGLAWSFLPGVVLPDLVKSRKKNEKKKNPAVATLKNCTLSSAVEKLNLLFKELEIHTKLIRENPSRVEMSITAMRNTWTHQRRKRRANKRQNKGIEADKDGDSDCKKSRLDSKYVEQVVGETSNSDGKLRLDSKYVEQVVGETSKVNAVSMREGVEVSEKLGSDSCLEKLRGKDGLISEKFGSFPEKEGSSNNLGENHVQIVTEKIETIKNSSQSITEQSSILSDVSKEKLKDSTQNGSGNPPDTSNIVEKDQVESDVVEKGTVEIPISSNDVSEVEKGKNNLSSPDENVGLDDYIGNKWADIDTLPLLTADLLIQNLGKDVMVAISLADGCVGGWEVVHQIRQTIINRVEL